MKKRLFSILTALALCLSLLPTAALAVSTTEPPQGTHTINGTTYTNVYELSTKEHLYWLSNYVNSTYGVGANVVAVLVNDIVVNENVLDSNGNLNSGSFEEWTPIGKNVDNHRFLGKFDGQGHTISGLYCGNSSNSYVGLFGIVESPASIYRVGVVDSYFAGNSYVGGLCGKANSDARIESCYTTATVSGTSNVGTFCGYSTANINNCYSAGRIDSSYGTFLGNEGTVDYCYALSNENKDGTNDSDLKYRTIDAFTSGEVTYGLTKNQATPSWRQTIGTHPFPQCTTDGAIVYLGKKDSAVYYHNHTDGEARCPYCSVPDFYNNEYLIDNKEELYWFAGYVNDGHPAANANVRYDITVDNDWVPIGNGANAFTGRFAHPADQKTISGIPESSSLFGAIGSGAEIARITVTSGSLCATSGGEIVDCHVSGGGMLVSGANSGTVSDSSAAAGGTLIANNSGTVKNSSAPGGTLVQTNTGTITDCHDEGSGASLCANNAGGIVTDCYVSGAASSVLVGVNSGTVQMSYAAGGATLCTTNSSGGKIINCYATGTGSVTLCSSNSGTIANCFAAGGSGTTVGSGGTITNCYALADSTATKADGADFTTTAPFASGEVAYRLNQGTGTYPGGVWGQTIGTDIGTDKLPIFGGKAVYYKQNGSPEYHNHNGYCSICTITPTYANDKWQITNVDELYWYAQYIKGTISGITDKTKNAILMNDITVNSNVLNADGTLSDAHTSFTEWTPIGISSSNYDGTFDGNHHTISGLYVNAPGTSYVGFFGYIIGGGTIKNLTIADSYFKGNNYVGGVCGYTSGAVSGCSYSGAVTGIEGIGGICGQSQGTVSGCTNRGKVTGNNKFGGICGYAYNGTVSGCINYGAVNGSGYVGGICGYALYGEVSGCINYGAVTGIGDNVGGVCGVNRHTVSGCTNYGAVTGRNCVGGVCGICEREGTVIGCTNTGAVTGTGDNVGGVCGDNQGTISGCYSIGTVTGTSSVGGVCGDNSGTVSNCYHNSEAYSGNAVGNGSGTVDSVLGKTTKEFASGAVAYLLNGSTSVGTAEAPLVWYQNIDSGIPDAAPQFTGGTVYATLEGSPCPGYTNNANGIKQHKYENYVCIWCGHQDTIPVTVSGIKANNKEYDGTTTATLDFSGVILSGVVSGDTVTVNATGTFEDKDVGANKTVTITGLTLTGTNAGKYRLADSGQQATATASITRKSVTAAVTVTEKTYDGNTSAAVSAVVTVGVESGDTITISGLTGTFADAGVGTGKTVTVNAAGKSITGTGSGNYDVTIPTTATGTINQARAVITVEEGKNTYSKTYGDSDFQLEGITENSDDADVQYAVSSGMDVVSVSNTGFVTILKAGEATITLSLPGSTNYLAAQNVSIHITVAKKSSTVSITGNPGKTYDGRPAALTAEGYTATGDGTVTVEYTKQGETNYSATAPTDAGSYTVRVTQAAGTNYAQAEKSLDFTITPKEVTVEAGTYKVNKTYDGTTNAGTPSGELTVTGILDADSGVSVVPTPGAYTSPNVGGQSTVAVSLALNGTGSANYRLAADTVNVPCTITAKPITISTASATNRNYAEGDTSVEADVAFTGAVNPLAKGADYTVAGTMDDDDAGTGKTVNVTVTLLNGNYALAVNTTTTTVNIGKIAYPGATAANGSAMYGNTGRVDLSNYLADGYVIGTITKTNGDIFTGAPGMDGTALTFSFANVPGNVGQTAVITVPVTGATNYDPYSIAVTVTVEAKTVPTVTAPTAAAALIYSGEAQTLISAGTTTGGEMQYSLTSGTGYSTELPTAVNAGDYTVYYKVVGSSDYADVAENSLTVTIGKKEVTATPKDVTITRGSAIPAFELIYTGLLGEDTLTPSTDPTFTCFEADGTTSVSTRTAAGTYTITWTNTDIFDDETNYRVVAAPGTLTINNPSYSGGSSTPSYSVTVPKTENGTITVSPKSASRGGTVTITVTPDDGYTLETLTATDSKGNEIELTDKGNGKYTFQMPASKVTVEATFVPVETEPQPCDGGVTCPAYHFTDVDTSAWYHEAVDYVLLNGIMSGYGGGLFGPNDSLSRAQLAQILYNREGQPTTGSSGVFTDVAGDAWYSDAVTWANLSGIVEGYGNGRFGPNDPITREQLAVMLYRYAQLKGKGFTGMWAFRLDYADAASVSDYAYEAMCWCTMNGVISGYEDKTLRPQNNATRAQVAQMLKNFLENIGK